MTPQQREAALRLAAKLDAADVDPHDEFCVDAAAALLRELAAAPQGEPVAWLYETKSGASFVHRGFTIVRFDADIRASKEYQDAHKMTPLYAHPPQRQTLPEDFINDLGFQCGLQREDARHPGVEEFARAIEAAHGIGETP